MLPAPWRDGDRWYVPRALRDETAKRVACLGGSRRVAALVRLRLARRAAATSQRQDANEPDGRLPGRGHRRRSSRPSSASPRPATSTSRSRTPATRPIPDLAVTIYTGDDEGRRRRSRSRSDQPGLANPNRPVWILENDYPKLLEAGDDAERPRHGADRRRRGAPRPTPSPSARSSPATTRRHRLARDPGRGRHLHRPLRGRRRPRRQGARR